VRLSRTPLFLDWEGIPIHRSVVFCELGIIPKHKMATLFCAFKTLTGFGF
jgi:hypothetical protein